MPKTSHTIRVISDRLTQPVGRFMRPCVSVDAFTSVHIAIERMREAGQEVIPVVIDGTLQGVLTESGILKFVAENGSPNDPVSTYAESAATVLNRATGAEALRQLEKNPCLIVIDEQNALCGLVTPSCFVGTTPEKPRPHMVGGMATPFGVYLTSGTVSGGKKGWYLFSTGFFLISLVIIGGAIADSLARFVPNNLYWQYTLQIIALLPMIAIFRLHPISGYHAAEHQVVHAIERDENLTPEVVERMPRVHPRCGTNLAVAAGIFSFIVWGPWDKEGQEGRVFLGLFVTLFLWRSVGSFVQYWITTKKPSRQQIESGIQAAKELLANYEVAPARSASPWVRIMNSGLLHVITGSLAALGIAFLIGKVFGIEIVSF